MKKLFPFDFIVAGYFMVVTTLILVLWPKNAPIYLAYHALGGILVWLLLHAYGRFGGRLWTFARHWYPLLLVLAAFRELHYLIPEINPFSDRVWDRRLAAIDRTIFGDVDGFFLSISHPVLVDLLHLAYWSYFFLMAGVGAILWGRNEQDKFREYSAVILLGFFLSYLGYIAVPAVGPHHFFPSRPAELDGFFLGDSLHRVLLALEWEMPDAFPSGHALMSILAATLAWRYDRNIFRVVLIPAVGCVWATMALRYHYVVDVLASFILVPVILWIEMWFRKDSKQI